MSDTSVKQITLENLLTKEVHELRVPTIIGRHEDCDLVLVGERGASRKHARVTVEDGLVVLMDLGSLNGTIVNGHEINRPVQLADGDVVLFDKQEYQFGILTATEDISQNVTVIANKAEMSNPENIKPAIQIVDDAPIVSNDSNDSFDEPPPIEAGFATDHDANNEEFDLDGFDKLHEEPIAATSRPGGHTPINNAQRKTNQPAGKSSAARWLFICFILISLILFVAYLNDFQFLTL